MLAKYIIHFGSFSNNSYSFLEHLLSQTIPVNNIKQLQENSNKDLL